MPTIANRLHQVRNTLHSTAAQNGRCATELTLVAASKTQSHQAIVEAWQAGQRHFGENYVQEGILKIRQLKHLPDLEWHLIGPLQSNKTKVVAEHFSWVQTVDRLKIAERLSQQRPSHMAPLQVCLQVNISGEESKSGILPAQLDPLADQVARLPNLCLRGLMAIPKASTDDERQRQPFEQMYRLFDNIRQRIPSVDTLSLGMSGDMHHAISQGSTMVRIGTAIFGPRHRPPA